jgi:hypothetical protein
VPYLLPLRRARVLAAFLAAFERLLLLRADAALLACRESACVDADACPSRFSAAFVARDLFGDDLVPFSAASVSCFALRGVDGDWLRGAPEA